MLLAAAIPVTVTVTLHWWWVPLGVLLAGVVCFVVASVASDRSSGFLDLSGLIPGLLGLGCVLLSLGLFVGHWL